MTQGVTERVISFVSGTDFRNLPSEVVEKTKQILLDSVGCALGGWVTDRAKIANSLSDDLGGKPQACVIGGHRTSYAQAAFVNGELINALDYDAYGIAHIVPFTVPACLAAAERTHASGKDLIAALALSHEVATRLTGAMSHLKVLKEEAPYWEDSPRFSHGTASVLGGVVGAGKLLGLDAGKMANAFGICGASAPVPGGVKWQHVQGPAIMLKYNAWSGWASQLAIIAALAAEKGFTGDTTILDGEFGFWRIIGSAYFKTENLFGGLGEKWLTLDVEFKPYPVCMLHHGGIQAITRIVEENAIKPESIEEIVVKADPLLQTPNRMGLNVAGFADTQFMNNYIFALAPYYGNRPGPAWQIPSVYNSPEIKSLMGRVRVETHPRASQLMAARLKAAKTPAFWDTIVELTAGGKKYSTEVTQRKGSRDNPMTSAELHDKFKGNACYSQLTTTRVDELIEMLDNLEDVEDINSLAGLLVAG